jgi:YD repeat-containing protein
LTQLFNLKSNNSVISGFDYGYDSTPNRTHVLEANGDRVTWTYDDSYQLINENRSGANAYNTTFVYDPVGNRLLQSASGALTTYSYDAANQLVTGQDAAGVTTYTFDSNGNQQVDHAPSGRTTYTWDFENQNTRVELPSGVRVTMSYNADFRRMDKE